MFQQNSYLNLDPLDAAAEPQPYDPYFMQPRHEDMTTYGSPIHEVRLGMKHLPIIQLQRGPLLQVGQSPQEWAREYRLSLLRDFEMLKPYLPGLCKRVLDVGGGMGGLGILIQRYYNWGRGGTESWILDGAEHDSDLEIALNEPHNDAELMFDYWNINAVRSPTLISAVNPVIEPDVVFDLVVSTQAWGYHFEPDAYAQLVRDHSHGNTWLMLDVRKNQPEWLKQLEQHWHLDKVLHDTPKYMRSLWLPHRSVRR